MQPLYIEAIHYTGYVIKTAYVRILKTLAPPSWSTALAVYAVTIEDELASLILIYRVEYHLNLTYRALTFRPIQLIHIILQVALPDVKQFFHKALTVIFA